MCLEKIGVTNASKGYQRKDNVANLHKQPETDKLTVADQNVLEPV